MKRSKWKKIIYWCTVLILLAVFVVSGYMVWQNYQEESNSADQYEALEELVPEEPVDDEEAPLTAAEKYATVAAKNEHFVGWISIGGTAVNYPVVQTPEDPEYYLRRGYDQKYSYYGVPFVDADCTVPGGDNIVIYGHNMDNGTMFADVENYREKSFYEEHRYIRFDTLDGFGTYEVIAVVQTVAGADDEFEYFKFTDAADASEFDSYVADCKKHSLYGIDATAEYGEQLITLSTCEYSAENGRFAVIAKKNPAQ